MAGSRKILLAVTIDTECDKGAAWKTLRPLAYRSVLAGIPQTLAPLFARQGVRPTYLLSPEVLAHQPCVDLLGGLPDCELGTHLHAEFIGPEPRPEAETTNWPQAACRPEVEQAKLRNLTESFAHAFGRPPVSFRGGRFSLSSGSLGYLADLGYKVDTTVTPFRTNIYQEGPPANYWGAALPPYHPAADDPRCAGELPLLEVPVSMVAPAFRRWPEWVLRRLSDRTAAQLVRLRWPGLSTKKYWVRPLRGTPEQLTAWADDIIDHWPGPGPAVINIMFHSNECWVGTSPYTLEPAGLEVFVRDLKALLEHLVGRRQARPVTLAELAGEFGIN